MIVDAHLDLAHNVLDLGRDITLDIDELRTVDTARTVPTVSLPALRAGGVGLCFATLWADPDRYPSPLQAKKSVLAQLALYQEWEEQGRVRIIRSREDLHTHQTRYQEDGRLGLVLSIEGAEPLVEPGEAADWAKLGVRLIGPAWRRTRYAGGTGEPGGLSPLGFELLSAMQSAGMALDTAHLAEEAFWDAMDSFSGPLCASHANARVITPTDRQLSDAMISAVGKRNGIVGTVIFNRFLDPDWQPGQARLPLSAVGRHLTHAARLIGWTRVGIGSDMDGGSGLLELPLGIDSSADLKRIGEVVPEDARPGVLGDNWLRWLESWLP